MTRQCSSCGGFCRESGCERENVKPEPEPVAYLCENAVGHKYFRWKKPSSEYKPIALYTAPPQREWVGLTYGEREQIEIKANDMSEMTVWEYARRVGNFTEAKLKDKNGY